eukprot:m.1414651 g.1414651  ORF g.1414651 m.1414651 type:complete len:338 (-) comp25029_c0_seq31:2213-3226(-)
MLLHRTLQQPACIYNICAYCVCVYSVRAQFINVVPYQPVFRETPLARDATQLEQPHRLSSDACMLVQNNCCQLAKACMPKKYGTRANLGPVCFAWRLHTVVAIVLQRTHQPYPVDVIAGNVSSTGRVEHNLLDGPAHKTCSNRLVGLQIASTALHPRKQVSAAHETHATSVFGVTIGRTAANESVSGWGKQRLKCPRRRCRPDLERMVPCRCLHRMRKVKPCELLGAGQVGHDNGAAVGLPCEVAQCHGSRQHCRGAVGGVRLPRHVAVLRVQHQRPVAAATQVVHASAHRHHRRHPPSPFARSGIRHMSGGLRIHLLTGGTDVVAGAAGGAKGACP